MGFLLNNYVYIIITLFMICSFIFIMKDDKKSLMISIALLVFFTIVMGLRYDVGIDFKNYELYFTENTYILSWKEPLWVALNKIIYYVNGPFFLVSFISLMITNLFIYLGIKKRFNKGIDFSSSIILFICNYAIIFLNIIRQGIAVSIIFYATSFLYEKKYLKYFSFCIIASLIHKSAFIALLFPILCLNNIFRFKPSFKFKLSIIILSYLLVYFNIPAQIVNVVVKFFPAYQKYANSIFIDSQGGSILSIGVLINAVICVFLCKYGNFKDDELYLDKSLYFLGVILNIFSISTFMIDRIGIYFSICSIVAIPSLIQGIKSDLNFYKIPLKKIAICFVLFFNFLYFAKTVFISTDKLNLDYSSVVEKYIR